MKSYIQNKGIISYAPIFIALLFLLIIPFSIFGASRCHNQIPGINRHEYCRVNSGTSLTINAENCIYSCRIITNNSGDDIFIPTHTCSPGAEYGEWDEFLNHLPPGITQGPCIIMPSVTTLNARNITNNSATLEGRVDSLGGDNSVEARFVYGTDSNNLNLSTPWTIRGAIGNFSQNIINLSANTTYYFQSQARNSAGTSGGSILSLTTPFCNPQETTSCTRNCLHKYCWNEQCREEYINVGGVRTCTSAGTWGPCVATCPNSSCANNQDCIWVPECYSDRDCGEERKGCFPGIPGGCGVWHWWSPYCQNGICFMRLKRESCNINCCPQDCGQLPWQPPCPC